MHVSHAETKRLLGAGRKWWCRECYRKGGRKNNSMVGTWGDYPIEVPPKPLKKTVIVFRRKRLSLQYQLRRLASEKYHERLWSSTSENPSDLKKSSEQVGTGQRKEKSYLAGSGTTEKKLRSPSCRHLVSLVQRTSSRIARADKVMGD